MSARTRCSWIAVRCVAVLMTWISAPAIATDSVSLVVSPPTVLVHGADPGDAIGASFTTGFAIGDISGDGVADLVIPVRDGDGPGEAIDGCGEVHVVFGPISLADARDLATQPADIVISGRTPNSVFGSSVLLADVDGDLDCWRS